MNSEDTKKLILLKVAVLFFLGMFCLSIHEFFGNVYYDVCFIYYNECIDIQWYVYDLGIEVFIVILCYIIFFLVKDISFSFKIISVWMLLAAITEIPEYILFYNSINSFWHVAILTLAMFDTMTGAHVHRFIFRKKNE